MNVSFGKTPWILGFAALAWSAAVSAQPPLLPTQAPAATSAKPQIDLDQEMAAKVDQIPGFGGQYTDEKGVLQVYLTDLSQAAKAQRLGPKVEVKQAQYDYRQLLGFRDAALALLAEPGIVFVDLDERANRIKVGVRPALRPAERNEVENRLAATLVPREALVLEESKPFVTQANLQQTIYPVVGGFQILNATNGGACTLGFHAYGYGTHGFVTNSHCTNAYLAPDGTWFLHADWATGYWLGQEWADPWAFGGGPCPPGRGCRYSDAIFAAHYYDQRAGHCQIARTTGWGSLWEDPANPRSFLWGAVGNSNLNDLLVKTGRTTGTTWGPVVNTCVAINAFDPNGNDTGFTFLCQNLVQAPSAGGDSGSPVYYWDWGTGAWLAGILWGGNGSVFVYSPWQFVVGELGGLGVTC